MCRLIWIFCTILPLFSSIPYVKSSELPKFNNKSAGDIKQNYSKKIELTKCCPADESYNYQTRQCEKYENPEFAQRFVQAVNLQNYSVIWIPDDLNCNILVDYQIDMPYVKVENFILKAQDNDTKKYIEVNLRTNLFCLDAVTDGYKYMVVRLCKEENYCDNHICVSECPKRFHDNFNTGEETVSNIKLQNFIQDQNNSNGTPLQELHNILNSNRDYGYLKYDHACNDFHIIQNTDWHLAEHNSIRVEDHKRIYELQRYCMTVVNNTKNQKQELRIQVCLGKLDGLLSITSVIEGSIQLISWFFILLTIIIMKVVPAFRKVYGRCLMHLCYHWCIFYFFAALIHFEAFKGTPFCSLIGGCARNHHFIAITYSQALCYLIWNGIGRSSNLTPTDAVNEKKMFRWFTIYACSVSLAASFTCVVLDNVLDEDSKYKPNIGETICWFPRINSYSEFFYFTVPTAAFLCVNVVFFVLTLINFNIAKVNLRNALSNYSYSYSTKHINKEIIKQFFVNIKLFFLMGIPLIIDVIIQCLWHFKSISLEVSWKLIIVEVLSNLNNVQGIVLFVIICMNKKTLFSFKQRTIEICIDAKHFDYYNYLKDSWQNLLKKIRCKKQ